MWPASSPCRYPSVLVSVFLSLSQSLCPCPCPCPCCCFSVAVFLSLSLSLPFLPLFLPPVPLFLSLLNRNNNRDGDREEAVSAKYLITEHKCSLECGSVNGMAILLYIHPNWRRRTNPSTVQQEIFMWRKIRIFRIKLQDA